jgi:hypothetical protein
MKVVTTDADTIPLVNYLHAVNSFFTVPKWRSHRTNLVFFSSFSTYVFCTVCMDTSLIFLFCGRIISNNSSDVFALPPHARQQQPSNRIMLCLVCRNPTRPRSSSLHFCFVLFAISSWVGITEALRAFTQLAYISFTSLLPFNIHSP